VVVPRASGENVTPRQPSDEGHDPGRSDERADQDRLLDREARRESWLTRLRRHRSQDKGRPDPGNGGGDGGSVRNERDPEAT
jgi:hypothetical protein